MAYFQNGQIEEPARTVPLRATCDVLVAGGGTAGVIAAIASARRGAQTVLVERYGSLGGAMINGATALHSFFNLYKAFPEVKRVQLVRGIPQELVDRMVAAGGSLGHLEMAAGYDYDSFATCFDHETFKLVILDLLEEAGVRLFLHTLISDIVMEDRALKGVIIETKSGREAILAKICVDCTGDGDVAFRAGVPTQRDIDQEKQHAVSLTFGLGGVDLPKALDYAQRRKTVLQQVVTGDKGSDTDNVVRIGFRLNNDPALKQEMDTIGTWGPLTVSLHEGILTYVNTTSLRGIDCGDVEALTRAEVTLRRQAAAMASLMQSKVPGFEKSYINWTSIQVGVRRTRIVACEYDLSLQEILDGQRFEDEIALYGFHDSAPRLMIKGGGAYGIPYRALLPRQVENLLVAGKMITSDWDAHMSTRNTVACMAQGQAAGTAAALCRQADTPPRQLDVQLLRRVLVQDGVFLGDV